jgi:hypothetical protein
MKKLLIVTLAALFGVITFTSCKKEHAIPKPSVVGYWKGKFGIGQQNDTHGYAFIFRENGTVRVYYYSSSNPDTTVAAIADGTYLLTGNQVNTTHIYLFNGAKYSTVSTINASSSYMEGDWVDEIYPSIKGKFFLHKH